MKASLLITLSVGLTLGLGACERHSWDSTKRLYPAPPDQEAVETTTDEQDPDAAAANGDDGEATGERDTSVVP